MVSRTISKNNKKNSNENTSSQTLKYDEPSLGRSDGQCPYDHLMYFVDPNSISIKNEYHVVLHTRGKNVDVNEDFRTFK